MAADVTIVAALFAGLLSFLSPCVLPLVPPYLVYLAGASLERLADAEPEPRVRRETIAGRAAVRGRLFHRVRRARRRARALIGALVLRFYSRRSSRIVAGVAIIVMGLHFLGITPIRLLHREARLEMQKPVGLWGAYVMGLAFAFGWTPCIGPILAAILAVAASQGDGRQGRRPARGLFARARHAVPRRRLRGRAVRGLPRRAFARHLAHVEKVMGGLLVLTGIAFLTGFVTRATGCWRRSRRSADRVSALPASSSWPACPAGHARQQKPAPDAGAGSS